MSGHKRLAYIKKKKIDEIQVKINATIFMTLLLLSFLKDKKDMTIVIGGTMIQ